MMNIPWNNILKLRQCIEKQNVIFLRYYKSMRYLLAHVICAVYYCVTLCVKKLFMMAVKFREHFISLTPRYDLSIFCQLPKYS